MFDKNWEEEWKAQGMGEAAAELMIAAQDSYICHDDGEFYPDWKEFKSGGWAEWPLDGEYDPIYNPDSIQPDQKKEVKEFFRRLYFNIERDMQEKFGKRVNYRVRQPLVVFPDLSLRKQKKAGFYGWVSLVVVPEE